MDTTAFARTHISQMTAVAGLMTYALSRRKLTAGGVFAAVVVAAIHMLHPWPAFFWLPILFFLLGTVVTKIGQAQKSHLTLSSMGGTGGEEARTFTQVLANSGFACVLILLHIYLLSSTPFISSNLSISAGLYSPALLKSLPIGIVAHYAAVTADTFSSELGILATTEPFLITAPWKSVPKGTNGGVTIDGLMYGALGSFLLVLIAILGLYVSPPQMSMNPATASFVTVMGLMGSVIDSVLGAIVQSTVTDKGTGKVVEGPGGQRVKVSVGGSRTVRGADLLTNNGVNFVMAAVTSLLAMGFAYGLGLDLVAR